MTQDFEATLEAWQPFFAAELGAAAALGGLLFVSLSLNLTKILSYPALPVRALIALVLLLALRCGRLGLIAGNLAGFCCLAVAVVPSFVKAVIDAWFFWSRSIGSRERRNRVRLIALTTPPAPRRRARFSTTVIEISPFGGSLYRNSGRANSQSADWQPCHKLTGRQNARLAFVFFD
jgi:hypothetical protein